MKYIDVKALELTKEEAKSLANFSFKIFIYDPLFGTMKEEYTSDRYFIAKSKHCRNDLKFLIFTDIDEVVKLLNKEK